MGDRGWSETPADLLLLISNQIHTVKDFLSFRSVCKPWRSSVSAVNFLMPPPQLLTQQSTDTSSTKQDKESERYFLGFTKVGILNERLFKSIGSKQNWIVTVDIKSKIRILNPFSNTQFQLPTQTAWNFKHSVSKVVLSSTPDKPNCVAVALCVDRLMCMARPGNRSWTIITRNIDDVVFFNGEFYAANWSRKLVSVFDINCLPIREIAVPPLPNPDDKTEYYLVEHSEKLIMVSRKYLSGYYHIEVYKFNFENASFDRVKHLRKHWLFLGFHTSVLMPVPDDPSPLLNESVYYTNIENEGGVCIKRFDMITQNWDYWSTDHVSFKSLLEFDYFQQQ